MQRSPLESSPAPPAPTSCTRFARSALRDTPARSVCIKAHRSSFSAVCTRPYVALTYIHAASIHSWHILTHQCKLHSISSKRTPLSVCVHVCVSVCVCHQLSRRCVRVCVHSSASTWSLSASHVVVFIGVSALSASSVMVVVVDAFVTVVIVVGLHRRRVDFAHTHTSTQ